MPMTMTLKVYVKGMATAVNKLFAATGWSMATAADALGVTTDTLRHWRTGATVTIRRGAKDHQVVSMRRVSWDQFNFTFFEEMGQKPQVTVFDQ